MDSDSYGRNGYTTRDHNATLRRNARDVQDHVIETHAPTLDRVDNAAREAMKRKGVPLSAESKKADAALVRLVKKSRELEKVSVELVAQIAAARGARDEAFTADRLKAGIWTDANGRQLKISEMEPVHLSNAVAFFERKLSFVGAWKLRLAALRKEAKRRETAAKKASKRSAK